MTEYEIKLRDDLAKIAFQEVLKKMIENEKPLSEIVENTGKFAFDIADCAIRARKAI